MTLRYLSDLTKPPVLLLGLAGLVLAWGMLRERMLARTRTTPARGVAIILTGGTRFLVHPAYGPFDQSEDSPRIQLPPQGFRCAAVGRRFTAYLRC